jgi:hypothetical protein
MKRYSLALIALLMVGFSLPTVEAATPVVRVVDVPHRNFDGTFRDNELAMTLTPGGRLGKALFQTNSSATWVIDAYLIDEISDMADGYTFEGKEDPVGKSIAEIWLQQLKIATVGNPIVALPYGNPDAALARKLAPSEIKFYSALGASKLEQFFGRPVISQNGWGNGKSRLESQYQEFYRNERTTLLGLSKIIDVPEITDLRQRLGIVLNPLLSVEERVRAEDQGDFYKIPLDTRTLDYQAYFEKGRELPLKNNESYNSHNTKQLSVDEVVSLISDLSEFVAYREMNNL